MNVCQILKKFHLSTSLFSRKCVSIHTFSSYKISMMNLVIILASWEYYLVVYVISKYNCFTPFRYQWNIKWLIQLACLEPQSWLFFCEVCLSDLVINLYCIGTISVEIHTCVINLHRNNFCHLCNCCLFLSIGLFHLCD